MNAAYVLLGGAVLGSAIAWAPAVLSLLAKGVTRGSGKKVEDSVGGTDTQSDPVIGVAVPLPAMADALRELDEINSQLEAADSKVEHLKARLAATVQGSDDRGQSYS